MSVKTFLDLVEIKTKLASLTPFVIGVLFTLSYFNEFHIGNTIIFFIGMLCFDMATTAINNYMDFRKAKSEEYKYTENVVGREHIPEKLVQQIIFGFIFIAFLVGMYLSYKTGWLLLVMGCLCCFIGVFYTFGPVPLSRMPLGELFSGVTMGLGIFAMVIYINIYQSKVLWLHLSLKTGQFALTGNLWTVLAVIWASIPMICTIANIMLANNLCDLDQDIENHRYTLPYYIGRKNGVFLFNILMYLCFITVTIGLFFGLYHWTILLIWVVFPMIRKNLQIFTKKQIKRETFSISIKNLIVFNGAYALCLLLGLLF